MKKFQKIINNYAFIDSQNVNLAIIDQGWRLDWKRYRDYLKFKYNITKAYLFIGYIEKNRPLYLFLKNSGYEIVFKPTVEIKNGETKGNVDAELVLHTMIQYPNFNKAIINSGDGDFHCLVEYLKLKNKLLKLIIPNQFKYSSLLRNFREDIVFMNGYRGKMNYQKKREALS
ncbi:MAG: NYN domain-containing protein [bacterium]|nr:NYN domain-containing protein [bacterium]